MTDQSVKILDAALKLYTAKPPHDVSVEEIAREAGVSKSLIFYHFRNKQNLIKATVLHAFNRILNEFNPESLEDFVNYGVGFIKQRRELIEFLFYAFGYLQGEVEEVKTAFEEAMKKIQPLFEGCRYPKETALAIAAMLDGLSIYSLYCDIGEPDRYRRIALEFVESQRVRE
ncbi:TetR/AcrR family transcriptional regulator [Archaeoglobus neptunius]|uniref:TetR/AcrR family transcriptional regulator n=1 Tax=Archaeoglobus neptunius TaxID=2798580 RepID=UPI0019256AAA|nr:TetR/AcrR family transcriptional regulator [Archaeoglobus neptunius]